MKLEMKWIFVALILIAYHAAEEWYKYVDHKKLILGGVTSRMELLSASRAEQVLRSGITMDALPEEWFRLLQSNRQGIGVTSDVYIVRELIDEEIFDEGGLRMCERLTPSYFGDMKIYGYEGPADRNLATIYDCPPSVLAVFTLDAYDIFPYTADERKADPDNLFWSGLTWDYRIIDVVSAGVKISLGYSNAPYALMAETDESEVLSLTLPYIKHWKPAFFWRASVYILIVIALYWFERMRRAQHRIIKEQHREIQIKNDEIEKLNKQMEEQIEDSVF